MSLLQGMVGGGAEGRLYINRNRAEIDGLDYKVAVPRALAKLPYPLVRSFATRTTEAAFVSELRPGEVAYLWPAASLSAHETAHERGNPIVLEGINTRMARAREVLDQAYAAEGLEPEHRITDYKIAEEEQKLALATAIFAPSPGVEAALLGSPVAKKGIIPASYGVRLGRRRPSASRRDRNPVFLFVGSVSIRKGAHLLLRAWTEGRIKGTLLLAGAIEPAVAKLCQSELSSANVQPLGFVRNVDNLYRDSDVFVLPSFEEGDPLVTYEAAAHGLPIVASSIGAGRIGAETGCAVLVDPTAPETLVAALREMANSADVRSEWSSRAASAVESYGWDEVGAARAARLKALMKLCGVSKEL